MHFQFADLICGIKKEKEAGRLPPNVAAGMEELYWNYKNAVNEFAFFITHYSLLSVFANFSCQ